MTTYGVQEWQREAAKLERTLEGQVNEVQRRRAEHQQKERELELRRDHALSELSAALLPAMTRAAVAQAAEWTGYLVLRQEDFAAAMEADRAKLAARIAEIEATPAFADREALRHPETGSLTLSLEELKNDLRPLDRFLEKAKHPRLQHLLEVGYGMNLYSVPWWRMSYYNDWKAGDEILERFADKNWDGFKDFRRHYRDISQAADAFRDKLKEIKAQIYQGEELEAEHARSAAALGSLEEQYLGQVRVRIEAFLNDTGATAFAGRLDAVPELALLAKRWAGLREQVRTMEQLEAVMLEGPEQRFSRDLAKVRRKQAKYRRPNKRSTRFSEQEFQRTFTDRTPKYRQHWGRYDSAYGSLSTFDRYDEGSFDDDHLWWDTFMDGRQSGNYLPEIRRYRDDRPQYRYRRPKRRVDDGQAAAAAAEADYVADDDDLFDAS